MSQYELAIGPIKIHLPDEGQGYFSIFEDLAELFGKEYQSEAVKLLRTKVKNIKPKPSIDYESDNTYITTANVDTLISVISALTELSAEEFKLSFTGLSQTELHQKLSNAKKNRPKPKVWDTGDVFTIPLSDGNFTVGQVLDKKYCTCALFEIKVKTQAIDSSDLKKLKPISILHLGSDLLDKGQWSVIFNSPTTLNPNNGRGGRFGDIGSVSYGGGRMMNKLADAFWGLIPWNVMQDENYYDEMLLPGVERPENAMILSPTERSKYRAEKFGIIE